MHVYLIFQLIKYFSQIPVAGPSGTNDRQGSSSTSSSCSSDSEIDVPDLPPKTNTQKTKTVLNPYLRYLGKRREEERRKTPTATGKEIVSKIA